MRVLLDPGAETRAAGEVDNRCLGMLYQKFADGLGDAVEAYARDLEAQVEQKNRRLKDSL